jgi:hypothetical protein
MTPDELADYEAAVEAERARMRRHLPPRTPEDHAYLAELTRELDAAPSLDEYYQRIEPPYPSPFVDDDTELAVDQALELLAGRRRLAWLGDGPAQVHLLASLLAQLHAHLGKAMLLSHDQELDWPDIAQLAGMPLADTIALAEGIDPEEDASDLD